MADNEMSSPNDERCRGARVLVSNNSRMGSVKYNGME